MAINMGTIKFGENGKVYAVNAPTVTVIGELTEANQYIDFGTFENGLTELECTVQGVTGTEGNYIIPVINGIDTTFLTASAFYSGVGNTMRIKKIGNMWTAYAAGAGSAISNFYANSKSALDEAETITSFAIKAFSTSTFAAGTKYALEGR